MVTNQVNYTSKENKFSETDFENAFDLMSLKGNKGHKARKDQLRHATNTKFTKVVTNKKNLSVNNNVNKHHHTSKRGWNNTALSSMLMNDKHLLIKPAVSVEKTEPRSHHHNDDNNNFHQLQNPSIREAPINSNPFQLSLDQNDFDICKNTAIQMINMRKSITVDIELSNHLNLLASSVEQMLYQQQQNSFMLFQQMRQADINNWLSTKTEEERRIYLDRR
jgi:hypothetical protein